MSRIRLRSVNGKWKYETTVDDPLFAPILGAMFEEGMTMPEELTIEGSLGEALEREWKYIVALQEWMKWEKEAITQRGDTQIEPRDDGITHSREMVDVLGGPPPPTVWRHQFTVLATALSLPLGWESFVAVDNNTPMRERLLHMRVSMDYLLTHQPSFELASQDMTWAAHFLLQTVVATRTRYTANKVFREFHYTVPYLAPFIRNLWLTNRGNTAGLKKRTVIWPRVEISTLLLNLDWPCILEYLSSASEVEDYKQRDPVADDELAVDMGVLGVMLGSMRHDPNKLIYGRYTHLLHHDQPVEGLVPLYNLARVMAGEVDIRSDLTVQMCVSMRQGPCFTPSTGYTSHDTNLPALYTKLLSYLPEDASLEQMGLEAIVGLNASVWEVQFPRCMPDELSDPVNGMANYAIRVKDTFIAHNNGAVRIKYIVPWIHAVTLKYVKWYKHMVEEVGGVDKNLHIPNNSGSTLVVSDFPYISSWERR